MKEQKIFDIIIELNDVTNDFEVKEVKGTKEEYPTSDLANLVENKEVEFKNVQIVMMRILDKEAGSNRWCVVGGIKIWCPG